MVTLSSHLINSSWYSIDLIMLCKKKYLSARFAVNYWQIFMHKQITCFATQCFQNSYWLLRRYDWLRNSMYCTQNEPRHDKTKNMCVRPAKTQISLGIRSVWSESSLCAQWVAKDPRFLHADSEDSDQTGWMPRLIWVFAGRTHFVGFVM